MTNETESSPPIPTAAELRRDVANRSADFGGFHEDEGGPDDYPPDTAHVFQPSNRPGFEHTCSACGGLAHDEEHDQGLLDASAEAIDINAHAFADTDDGVLGRHPFDLGGES